MKVSGLAAGAAITIIALQGVAIFTLSSQISEVSRQVRAVSYDLSGAFEGDEESLAATVDEAKEAAEDARDAAAACQSSN